MNGHLAIHSKKEAKELVNLAISTGQLLIRNGAEIYRAEDTMILMCESRENLEDVDVFALHSAIFISCEFQGETVTVFKNVEASQINLDRIQALNTFSRNFVRYDISMNEARNQLKKISLMPTYNKYMKIGFTGLCTASFAVLFGGYYHDFIYTFFVGAVLAYFQTSLDKKNIAFFLEVFFASLMVSLLALVGASFNEYLNMDKVIIGSIMPLVPGMTVTTALRDIISGDYLSGVIGIVRAIFTAFAIALGVGIVLNIQLFIGGVS